MSNEIHPKTTNPALITDGGEALHNDNFAKKGVSKNPTDRSVQGTKPHLLKPYEEARNGK